MPRKAKELSPLAVSRLTKPGLHFVGGVAGLTLQISPTKARSWLLRYLVAGKRREMGLGGYPDVSLSDARRRAREEREKLDKGLDPILARREAQSALRAQTAAAITFERAALSYIEAHEPGWRNAKHAQQWRNSLDTYAYPVIGPLLVRDVAVSNVLAVLEPIWQTKTETASRLRGRIEQVLDWSTVRGYREGLNPARWRGHLDKMLPAPSKVATVGHHAALPASQMGAFMQRLREQAGMGARALEFAILCASRSGEVRGATWDEIDLAGATWKIPGPRMKAGREHRVPLSPAALQLLKDLPRMAGTDLVFPAPRGGQLSDMTLTAVMRRMEVPAVPHGFRSTFRDWCSERTNYSNQVAEMALAHAIGDKVEAAYRRGDLFDKRCRLMADWAAFCDRVEGESAGEVVPINKRA
ncbi:MAG: integrase arm-type DNA-binding domain-containing protein [Rhodoferax sp.]|nr:integrase arm-type DNA-binding domain-containing protein [Rhodoferax sp.]